METVQNTSIQNSIYRDLPLSQLQESPFNPRKRFQQTSLEELAQSIRAQGVLAPLLVRELDRDRFEIVAGSRRYRAAQIAELPELPVRIVTLSDAEAQLAMAIENLQREDVHPLEEARAFANLFTQHYDIPTIAAKVGRSERFVAERIRLNELIPPIAEAFLEEKLTVGHALVIAKLPPSQQQEAFTAAYRKVWTSGGDTQILAPVRELVAWIESNILLDLASACFDRHDPDLFPEAGSCDQCPKRTGANTLLFSGNGPDSCLDRDCYSAKIDRQIARALQQKPDLVQISPSWGAKNGGPLGRNQYVEIVSVKNGKGSRLTPAQKRCPHLAKGILVEGGSRGQVLTICADPTCPVHFAEAQHSQAAQEKARAERDEQDEQRKLEMTTRQRVLAAVLAKVNAPLTKPDLTLVAEALLDGFPHEHARHLALRHKLVMGEKASESTNFSRLLEGHLKTLDETHLCRLLMELALLDAASNFYSKEAPAVLEGVAKRYRIPIAKTAETVASEFVAKRNKQEQRRASSTTAKQQSNSKSKAKGTR